MSLLDEPHIVPLTDFVRGLRAERGDVVPWFDPTEAGAEARILLLFENPGRRADAAQGSGFISADNDDPTAQNMWGFLREASVDRRRDIVAWNIVPWYLGDERKIGEVKSSDIREARPALHALLDLRPLQHCDLLRCSREHKCARRERQGSNSYERIPAERP